MNNDITFTVNEIFASINGEGQLAGELAYFIRLAGCNLKCSYCDTTYAQNFKAGNDLTISQIITKLQENPNIKNITLTGGEPLFQKNIIALLEALANVGYLINIETNGSVNLKTFLETSFADKLLFCCDYKLPSSLEEKQMVKENFEMLRTQDALKFVVGNINDLHRAFEIIENTPHKSFVYLSSVFNRITPASIVEELLNWSKTHDAHKIRVQLQLHKYIWDPNLRGV